MNCPHSFVTLTTFWIHGMCNVCVSVYVFIDHSCYVFISPRTYNETWWQIS